MNYIKEKVAYLEGMIEGMEYDMETKEGKILASIMDILDDITDALGGLADAQDDLQDYVEVVSDDVTDLRETIIDDLLDFDLPFDDYEDEELYEVRCPECGETFLADFEEFDTDSVVCPECKAPFHLEEKVLELLTDDDHDDE